MSATSTQPGSNVPSDLDVAFNDLKPVLFKALGRLARQGFTVSPADGIDLIHDFLLEKIAGLKRRYEPSKGDFPKYAYAAFVRFARPRIVRLQRFRESLVNAADLERIPSMMTAEELELLPDYQLPLAQIIKTLPANEASILKTYIEAKVPSERLLAVGLGIPRYQIRVVLVRALGRVVTQLPRPPGIAERDWMVARSLWHDERMIDEAAAHLKLTTAQVRLAQVRVTKFLETALRNMQPERRYTRRRKMKAERYNIPARKLLGETLQASGDLELLQQLRDRSEEVIASLETDSPQLVMDDQSLNLDQDWLAEVYDALAEGSEFTPEDQALSEALFKASEDDERAVGDAFREVLWPDLPAELHDLERWFAKAPRADSRQMEVLLHEPSVESGLPEAALFVTYGMTPMTLYRAMEAVSSALERSQDYGIIDDQAPISLFSDGVEAQRERQSLLSAEVLVAEIYTSAKCHPDGARSLYAWLISVAQYKPFLFEGFEAKPDRAGVKLRRIENKSEDLFERWRSQLPQARPKELFIDSSYSEEHARIPVVTPVGSGGRAIGVGAGKTHMFLPWAASAQLNLRNLIAVLPTPPDCPGEEHLQHGVTSGIARSLSLLPEVTVKRPHDFTTRFEQFNDVKVIQAFGEKLGVRAVLTSAVEPMDSHFRCLISLVDTERGQLWRKQYESSYAEVFEMAEDISRTVSKYFELRLPNEQTALLKTATTGDSEAQKLYMEGRYNWSQGTASGFRRAIKCYEKALIKDPVFSLAYAGQADCYNMLSFYTAKSPRSAFTKAKAAAYEALEFSERLPDAYASLACAHMFYYWKWTEAESGFLRALEINPSFTMARQWYAEYLTSSGRFEEAMRQVRLAQELEPNSAMISAAAGSAYFFARHYDLAIGQFEEAVRENPNLSRARFGLGIAYAQAGRYDEAIEHLRAATRLFPGSTRGLAALGYVSAQGGHKDEAKEILGRLLKQSEQTYISGYSLALIHLALGEQGAALNQLRGALEQRDPSLIFLNIDPRFDDIREHRRFQEVITVLGLAP